MRGSGDASARAEDAADWLRALGDELGLPVLATYGLTPGDVAEVVAKARRSSSMQGNPIAFTEAELAEVLTAAL